MDIHSEWFAREYDPRIEPKSWSYRAYMEGWEAAKEDNSDSRFMACFVISIVFGFVGFFAGMIIRGMH